MTRNNQNAVFYDELSKAEQKNFTQLLTATIEGMVSDRKRSEFYIEEIMGQVKHDRAIYDPALPPANNLATGRTMKSINLDCVKSIIADTLRSVPLAVGNAVELPEDTHSADHVNQWKR